MVPIVDSTGTVVTPRLLLHRKQVVRLVNRQADALYECIKTEPITVIVPAMMAALFAVAPLVERIVRKHPEMIGSFEFAAMQPRGGGAQRERRDVLAELNHSVAGKAVIIVDPVCETGDSYRKLVNHPNLRNGNPKWIKPLFIIVKERFVKPGTPPSIGKPLVFAGNEFLIGGGIGLDLDQRFREMPDLMTVPFGSRLYDETQFEPTSALVHV